MDFTVNNGAIQFPTKKGTTKAFCFSIGSVEGVFSYSGTRLYDLKGGYPHAVNGVSVDSYHDFQDEFLKAGGILPPNPEQLIQYLGDSYLGNNGNTYIEDISVADGEVEETAGVCQFDNSTNYIDSVGSLGYTENPLLYVSYRHFTDTSGWIMNRRTSAVDREWDLLINNNKVVFAIWMDGVISLVESDILTYNTDYIIKAYLDRSNAKIGLIVNNVEYSTDVSLGTIGNTATRLRIGMAGWSTASAYYLSGQLKHIHLSDYQTNECLVWLDFNEKSSKYTYERCTGEMLEFNGDTENLRQIVALDTPRLIRNYSLWRNDDIDKDDIEVPYLKNGTPIATEGGTPPDTGYYWVEDYENPVEAKYVTEADGFIWFRDRYDDKDNLDGTITKHPDAVQYQSMFSVPPFNSPYTLAQMSPNYENSDKYFANPDNGKQLWYAAAQSNEDQVRIYNIIGGVKPYQVTEGNYKVTEGDYFVTT